MITPKQLYSRRKAIAAVMAASSAPSAASAGLFDWLFDTETTAADDAPVGVPGRTTLKQYKGYSNAYEFGTAKNHPGDREDKWTPADPWYIDINDRTLTLDEVRGMPFSELLSADYRMRCVERWSMVVNYNYKPLSEIIEEFGDKNKKFVHFTSALDDNFPGQGRFSSLNWPYRETITMEEAMNPLCLAVFGNYGEPSKANGAPFRITIPWKYGYASPKFVVKIETSDEDRTGTWGELSRQEYAGNMKIVNPNQPHPRWSQANERLITVEGTQNVDTLYLNGYEEEVGYLYK
jgi:sulfoxide reductase catalytic subunit YedY